MVRYFKLELYSCNSNRNNAPLWNISQFFSFFSLNFFYRIDSRSRGARKRGDERENLRNSFHDFRKEVKLLSLSLSHTLSLSLALSFHLFRLHFNFVLSRSLFASHVFCPIEINYRLQIFQASLYDTNKTSCFD